MGPELVDTFSKKSRISHLIKIYSVGAQLFHADEKTDRQTGMTKLTIAFRNFANAPEKNVVT
jgi:hypothetical protein